MNGAIIGFPIGGLARLQSAANTTAAVAL